jgi:hypothetical protein
MSDLSKQPELRKPGWFRVEAICEFFDCTPAWFEATLRKKVPEEAIDRTGRAFLYHGRTIVELWADTRTKIFKSKVKGNLELGDLDSNIVSPALEKFRNERYKLARMERLEKQNKLIPRVKVRHVLAHLASVLRDTTDRLQKLFGPRVVETMDETLLCFEAEIEDLCALPRRHRDTGIPATTSPSENSQ